MGWLARVEPNSLIKQLPPPQQKFIKELFGLEHRLQLLFRATQHTGAQVEVFHEKCDGVAHTLTLVRTNFGRTLGGYTPAKWKSSAEG